MKTGTKIIIGILAVILIGGIIVYTKAVKDVPNDNLNTTLVHYDSLRGTRYTEIFLIGGNGITKDLYAGVYNTVSMNGYTLANGDSSPDSILNKMDMEALKKEYDVLAGFKNGPRVWTLDWLEANKGTTHDFQGLQAAWVAKVSLKGMNVEKKGSTAYNPTSVERRTKFGFLKGRPLFILDDPDGNAWVMKSCGLIVDPTMSYDKLMNLGERLKPAAGWKYRVKVIDQDLVLLPESGIARIVQDELGNTYDLTGPGYGNFKP